MRRTLPVVFVSLFLGCVGTVGLTIATSNQAFAEDSEKLAEKLRLEEELKKLAQRNAWAGVERKYLELVKLKIDLPFEDHDIGAQSAGYLGKTYEVYTRLMRAKKIDPRPEILDRLELIDKTYGRVDVQGHEKRRPELHPEVMPFAPDQRKSIEWAQTVMRNTGSFNGMLPAGKYIVGSQEFTVVPGPDFLVVKLTKMKRSEMASSGEGVVVDTVEYSGPVAAIGFNFLATPQPRAGSDFGSLPDGEAATIGAQPRSMSGSGLMVHGGYELGFNQLLGIAGTVGYSNMLDGKSVDTSDSGDFHAFHFAAGMTIRPGNARLVVGPSYNLYIGDGKAVSDWYDIGQDAEKYNPRDLDWHGFSVAPGAHLSFGYGLMDFGKLQGVVELGSNWCTDGERHFISVGLRIGIVPLIERFSG